MFGRLKNAHFRCNYLFLENGPFLWPFQVTKHYKNRGFSRHRGKTQSGTFGCKVPFWEGASKGALLSVIPKSYVPQKALYFIVFSAKHSFANMRECNLIKKNKNLTKIGGGLPECKKVFFWSPFWFWWFCFSFLCVSVLLFCSKKPKMVIFLHF